MEDSFNVRVDRAFGSLEAIKPSPSSLSSLWCLTDQEIERNEWIKDKITSFKDKNPNSFLLGQPSSTCHQDLESDIQELDEEEEEPDDHSNEEWNIRSSVGMDCTLDNEEEEDGFDKVALGRMEEGFYMRDVNDYEVEMDSNTELPNSFTHVMRDPRANRMAAKLRLKQDDDESIKRHSSVVPDYVRNPSKYTHYTFDSMDDVDQESNKKAYMELFNSLNNHDSPTSIVFTPRNKSSRDDSTSMNKNKLDMQQKKIVISIAEAEAEAEADVCVMEEDEPVTNKGKGGRRYRTKATGGDLE